MLLGVLAGIGAPRLLAIGADAEAAAVLANVDTIFDAVERFAAESGRLPRNANRGDFPNELVGYLPEALFTEDSLLGSPYDWDGPGTGSPFYGVSIETRRGSAALVPLYQAIDRLGDDGDPATGWITADGSEAFFKLSDK